MSLFCWKLRLVSFLKYVKVKAYLCDFYIVKRSWQYESYQLNCKIWKKYYRLLHSNLKPSSIDLKEFVNSLFEKWSALICLRPLWNVANRRWCPISGNIKFYWSTWPSQSRHQQWSSYSYIFVRPDKTNLQLEILATICQTMGLATWSNDYSCLATVAFFFLS